MMTSTTIRLVPSQVIRQSSLLHNIHVPSPTHLHSQARLHNHLIGNNITSKQHENIRIVLQNPNGISSEHNFFEYQLLLENMKSVDSDIVLLPETNLCWNRYDVVMATTKHRKNTFRFSKQVTSNSQRSYSNAYQPGGTASIVTNNVVGRFHSSITDESLGRWSISNLILNNGKQLSIVCCYQVCNQNINTSGPKTAWHQQWSILKEQGHVHPNPRKQFYQDLDKTLSRLTTQGNLIILAGDFNSTLGEDPTGIDRILIKYNLADPIHYHHGQYNCPTYSRGTKCIDYILISQELLPSVNQCGILPFDSITNSDHRPIYIDLNPKLSFGNPLAHLVTPPNRRLYSNTPKRKDKYISHLYQTLSNHNVFKRIELMNSLERTDYSSAIAVCESIDRDLTKLMIAAENRLRQPSPSPFSSVLSQACIKVSLLKCHLTCLQHCSNKQHTINRLQQQLSEPITLSSSIPLTRAALRDARNDVRQIRKDAIAHREEFLQALVQQQPSNKILRHIQRAEQMKRGFEKIRFATKQQQNTLVTHLDIPDDNLPPKQSMRWKRITDPAHVTSLLIARNTSHFGLAHGTPFTCPPISNDFDWTLNNPHYHNTVSGKPPKYHHALVDNLLSHLKRKVQPTRSTLSLSDLVSRFRKWKEATTTSPSRRHLGHYKSLLPPINYNLQDYMQTPEGRIMNVHLALLNFCARTGYSLQRWSNIITTMIPKESNNYKIHRLRVIHIYEADLTALFSIWSRRMILASTSSNTLNPGSYGARPGRTSTDPPFISLLQNEISALSRTSLCIGPNDAAQCYDRLIPNQALLSCLSHGMPFTAAKCIGSTLYNAKYFLRTPTSQSDSYWSHSSTTPIYGTGQGSGISPGICCVVYSDLFDLHSLKSPGATYIASDKSITTTINNIGFVDDTTTTLTDHHMSSPMSSNDLISLLQNSLQAWSDILTISGGAIELTKTTAYLLRWLFHENGTPFLSDSTHRTITIRRPNGMSHMIHLQPVSKAFKSLGFHLTPNQNMSSQFSHLLDKAHHLSFRISRSSVNHHEAYIAYFSVFLPAISYVLPLTTFTKTQCHRLQVLPTKLFLQKCGFVSSMKRAIVFGSRRSGGLGFRHPYTEQGIAHITKLFQTLRTPGQTCHLLLICIQEWQLNSGMSFPLLEYPSRPCPHLEGQWLTSTRLFLASIKGSISVSDSYTLPPLREHDRHLMDILVASTKFSTKRMQRLNYCRLFLQVTLLSEITNTAGTHLLSDFWCGLGPRPSPSLCRYPRQGCPSSLVWSEWRAAIRKAFCHPRSTRLRIPLGRWYTSSYSTHRLASSSLATISASPNPSPTWKDHLLTHVTPTISISLLQKLIYHKSMVIICACDGGATTTTAAFGWVICDGPRTLVQCYGPVDGHCPTAYRAECYGALSLILFLTTLLPTPLSTSISIYIDNLSLCRRLQQYQHRHFYSPTEAMHPERDVLIQIESLMTKLTTHLEFHHIKSHQDRNTPFSGLSFAARANCCADSLATLGMSTVRTSSRIPTFTACKCQLHLSNVTITSQLPSAVRHHAHLQPIRNHILMSRAWSDTEFIDWSFFGRLCLRHSHRIGFSLKWIHQLLPTGSVLHKRSTRESPLCPACGLLETNDHLLLCCHPSRKALYISLMSKLRRDLQSYSTNPVLADILIDGVDSVFSRTPLIPSRYPTKFQSLITRQSNIGWINLMRGFVTIDWTTHHSRSSSTSSRHILSCLDILWQSVFDIWSYRCNQRHSSSLLQHENELRRQVRLQITELYSLRHQVLPTDRHIFHDNLSDHLNQNTTNLQAWLSNHQHYLRQSVQHAQHHHITHTRPISFYFAPTISL